MVAEAGAFREQAHGALHYYHQLLYPTSNFYLQHIVQTATYIVLPILDGLVHNLGSKSGNRHLYGDRRKCASAFVCYSPFFYLP